MRCSMKECLASCSSRSKAACRRAFCTQLTGPVSPLLPPTITIAVIIFNQNRAIKLTERPIARLHTFILDAYEFALSL